MVNEHPTIKASDVMDHSLRRIATSFQLWRYWFWPEGSGKKKAVHVCTAVVLLAFLWVLSPALLPGEVGVVTAGLLAAAATGVIGLLIAYAVASTHMEAQAEQGWKDKRRKWWDREKDLENQVTTLQGELKALRASDMEELNLYVEEGVHGLVLPVNDPEGCVGAALLVRLTITNRESEPVTLDTVVEVRQDNPPLLPEWENFPISEHHNPEDITRWKSDFSPSAHHGLIMIDAHKTADIMKVLVFTLVDLTRLRDDLTNIASGAVHTLRLHDRNTGLLAHRALKITLAEETQEEPE